MYARIVENQIVEVFPMDAETFAQYYPEDFRALCIECPEGVTQQWTYDGGVFVPPPEPTLGEIEEAERTQAQAEAPSILSAFIQRSFAQTIPETDITATQFSTLAKAGLFTEWEPGMENVSSGTRFVHQGVVYQVIQDVSITQAHQVPGGTGMLAVYRPLSIASEAGNEPDGSLENPYTYLYGMDVYKDKYYIHEGAIYMARMDMIPCVWTPGTAGTGTIWTLIQ